jgi:hypothetical protein
MSVTIVQNALPITASGNSRFNSTLRKEIALPGWGGRIRTGESVHELPNWICETTWPEVGASPAADTSCVMTDLRLGRPTEGTPLIT